MARSFNGSNQFLQVNSAVATAMPITVSAWAYKTNTNGGSVFWIGDKDVANYFSSLNYRSAANGQTVIAYHVDYGGGTSPFAETTTTYTTNTWEHVAAIFASSSSRSVYLNGGNSDTDTTSATDWSNHDATAIGAFRDLTPVNYFAGYVANLAVWNVVLTATEIAVLAAGYTPLAIRPESIIAYWPLFARTSPEIDIIGGYNLTLYNTPSIAANPPLFLQSGLVLPPLEAIGVLGGLYRRRLIFAG